MVPAQCSSIVLRALAHIEGDQLPESFTLRIESDWGESWLVSDSNPRTSSEPDIEAILDVKNPQAVRLWWPHGIGLSSVAALHRFTFTLSVNGTLVDVQTIQVGIRTVETRLDELQGQRFKVNGQDVYMVGGNWIGTDQALRYSASEERYCDELELHRYAGLNLIRVWGGGTAERDQFYDCADRIGLLVYQEFWMTGDNNGRWAGNYSWPLNYDAYLANVEDTVKRLRKHPSLLFYGGCNECLAPRDSPWFPNPPGAISDGIQIIIDAFDPGRFYIPSSMGGVRQCVKPWAAMLVLDVSVSLPGALTSVFHRGIPLIRSVTHRFTTTEPIRWQVLMVPMECCSLLHTLTGILDYPRMQSSAFNQRLAV
jgi:hypothetical protein